MSYMVSPFKIAAIAKENFHDPTDYLNIIEFGSVCYDAGMVEVLRIVAAKHSKERVPATVQTKQQELVVQKKKDELMKVLNEEAKQLFEEYDEAIHNLMAFDADDHLIEGFVRGYRFLNNYILFDAGGREIVEQNMCHKTKKATVQLHDGFSNKEQADSL
ncbi:hypothetical protein [Parageobacillus thermoglucosidasius]|uniref:hypothetical protein n=1 Tax=Parageobacillus thermoglucosidasius TaxID=1426 RepID=UPI000E14F0D5|nr:hypothetical protein [Parageobacillus thermoglucosidasius]MED4903973.1 hypothetical protein [Parageobacillus thermoglucosidasius]MED4915703.1 hypothetical protein [Parageobacillus thermoglucosidasius]MED4945536.1 hypothetical protein [Parageobacillus thermoglucosidasius]MED4984103.1 hypothetical protein [Parageobacillus thermoglucosidasius]RDE18570.1 hypothetical protein DV714_20670 [Parageobacillus thermoglucosidasius]